MEQTKFRRYFAIIIVLLLVLFLIAGIYRFANGFFGGLLLYVILLPIYNFLVKKKFNKKIAASIIVLIALFVIIIPLILLFGIIGTEIFKLIQNYEGIGRFAQDLGKQISQIAPSIDQDFLNQQLIKLGGETSSFFLNTIVNAGNFIINLFLALFLLYYMLIQEKIFEKIEDIIPFNKKNSKKLTEKLKDISYNTVFVSGIIAIIQGGLLTISFLIFDIQGAFLWGFVTAILSFLPIIGTGFVWIPATIIQIATRDYPTAIGIFIFGLILSNVDNLIRPILGNKLARIHPLITIFGIFIGISFFGMIGIFVGPLLIAFTVLIIKMFQEEYY
jgi:predicted PurR-regulated permease PerM